MRLAVIFLLAMFLTLGGQVQAAGSSLPVIVVYEEGNAAWEQANAMVKELESRGVPSGSIELLRAGDPMQKRGFVVAIGMGAMKKVSSVGSLGWVGMMMSRSTIDSMGALPENGAVLVTDQPIRRFLELARIGLPGRNRLGLLVSAHSLPAMRQQKQFSSERGFELLIESATTDTLPKVLDDLLQRSDVLLALPDPAIHNRNTVPLILLASYRQGIPVVAYSEPYLNAGAVLALYSTSAQMNRQAAAMVLDGLRGRPTIGIVDPVEFKVGINERVARSLGLTLPPAMELEAKLRQ
jgi:putative tryptophan/tyrosine transport system substrate-binding protein